MDKEFVLKYLKPHHIEHNEGLAELSEVFGIEIIGKLFEHCESLIFRVPLLTMQKELIKEVLRENKTLMSAKELRERVGIPRDRFREYLREIEEEG